MGFIIEAGCQFIGFEVDGVLIDFGFDMFIVLANQFDDFIILLFHHIVKDILFLLKDSLILLLALLESIRHLIELFLGL